MSNVSDEIDFQIYGDDMQTVEVELDPGETVVAEAGAMNWMEEGIRFYRSANNVICSPGPIPPRCFAHVMRRKDGKALLSPSYERVDMPRVVELA